MEFTKAPVVEEESKVQLKKVLHKEVLLLLIDVSAARNTPNSFGAMQTDLCSSYDRLLWHLEIRCECTAIRAFVSNDIQGAIPHVHI